MKKGLFFQSQGYEVNIGFEGSYTDTTAVAFYVECVAEHSCSSAAFTERVLYDFFSTLKHGGLYEYVWDSDDPCLEPVDSCSPTDVGKGNKKEDVKESLERQINFVGKQTKAESSAITELVKYAQSLANLTPNQRPTNTPVYRIVTTKRIGDQVKPILMCKVTESSCETQNNVRFVHYDNDSIGVSFDYNSGWGEDREIRDSIDTFLERFSYQCQITYTGQPGSLVGQYVCYLAP
ncbi:hypothetical protein [Pseudoalteromonas sp. MMG012]|uniref:hypothetical protein n=1 Tax=Pseudoalteromonas sp. MMG012 TaxID=2822686 RepID=UPI001B3A6DB4|nr:hypothetical protein [Pseudoalteromonas sp. MMG012]MBQ4852318.1 hypothetical protein [Pseudoalteromonas sp. MMG012]